MLAYRSRLAFVLCGIAAVAFGPLPANAGTNDQPASASAVAISSGRIGAAVAALPAIARAIQRRSGVPGMAIAVVHDGKVVYAAGFGVRRIGTNERIDANTIFQLASVSKSLASTVVAGVVGQGGVKWSDPVAKYIAGFTLSDPYVGSHVTIADMFAHRSGLPDHAGDLLEDLGYNRAQIIRRLALEPLDPFRITYHYTNFGLTAAAQAVADAEHTTWEALSARVLYGPLGMTQTSSRWADYERAPDRAVLHVRVNGHWRVSSREPDAQSPAGGASSSVHDLAKWMILELNLGKFDGRQIIGRDALLATQQPQIVSNPPSGPFARASFYGYGMGVSYDEAGRLRLSHSGAFSAGAATCYEMLPSEDLGIVILTNGEPSGVPESIAKTFYDRVEFGRATRDWYALYTGGFAKMLAPHGELVGKTAPAHPKPALAPASYLGTYTNRYYGPATVSATATGLRLTLGPKHETYALRHWNGNVFSMHPFGEGSDGGPSAVTFTPAAGTGTTSMTIEYLNENGLGTFGKQ